MPPTRPESPNRQLMLRSEPGLEDPDALIGRGGREIAAMLRKDVGTGTLEQIGE